MLPFESSKQHIIYKHELYKVLGDIEHHPEMFGRLREVWAQYELLLMFIFNPTDVRKTREKILNRNNFNSVLPLTSQIKNRIKKSKSNFRKKRMKLLIKILIEMRVHLEMMLDQTKNHDNSN